MQHEILQRIQALAHHEPAREALRYGDTTISYGQLEALSTKLARAIRQRHPQAVDAPLAIIMPRGVEFVIAMIAAIKCGCHYVPIECPCPPERMRFIVENTGCTVALLHGENISDLPPALDCLEVEAVWAQPEAPAFAPPDAQASDRVYIMYTSGSSGKPKGVCITHENLLNFIRSFGDMLYHHLAAPARLGLISSFSFDMSVKQIFNALFYGHCLVIAPEDVRFFGRKLHAFYSKNNITVADGTPSHLRLMSGQKTSVLSPVRYYIVGGERLTWQTLHALVNFLGFAPVFINTYGPTECCVDVSYHVIDWQSMQKPEGDVPIGIPVRHTKLELYDDAGALIQSPDVPGELCVSGIQVAEGYVGLASDRFGVHPQDPSLRMYRTGDLAKYTAAGELIILGRKDRQVKINGNRIELDEVEGVIARCPGAGQVLALVDESKQPPHIAVYLTGKKEALGEVKAHVSRHLPIYMHPQAYTFLAQLPINSRGKTDLARLSELLNAGAVQGIIKEDDDEKASN